MTSEYLLDREMEHVYALLTPANRLVCRVCVETGLRVGDVVALKSDQLKRQFWIREAKTGKKRRVNLRQKLLEQLMRQSGPVWVFSGSRSALRHRTRQAVWADVKRASKALRMPQNVSPHSFRKVYSVKLLRLTGDATRVQRALNHSDMATTMIYAMSYEVYKAKYGDGV